MKALVQGTRIKRGLPRWRDRLFLRPFAPRAVFDLLRSGCPVRGRHGGRPSKGNFTPGILIRSPWVFALVIVSWLGVATASLAAGEFFEIQKIDHLSKPPRKGPAVYREVPVLDKQGKPTKENQTVFVPCLAVRVVCEDQIKASATVVKAYFYDRDRKLIHEVKAPTPAGERDAREFHALPVFFPKNKPETIFFALPNKVLQHKGEWSAVVVFGDKQGVHAEVFPGQGMVTSYDFPEKGLYENRRNAGPRKVFMDPLVEHVVKTRVEEQPQITLFLRPPIGMTDASQAKGVLAMCVIAGNVEEIRRKLRGIEPGDEMGGLLQFAEKHKLVILCWGSRRVRQPGSTWDEIDRKTNERMEKTFDEIADKWDRGIDELVKKYVLPEGNFLLWGLSDAGQYVGRMVIRKPERFLAVHAHVPNGFDAPRPEGNRVLWLLTTGEKDYCYERSLRFLSAARDLGYPITYKAIMGLGHSGHPTADALGLKFFEWALTMKAAREAHDKSLQDSFGRARTAELSRTPWPEAYQKPPFVGDVVNQEMFPGDRADMVPAGFRVGLPTKEIAEIWNRK